MTGKSTTTHFVISPTPTIRFVVEADFAWECPLQDFLSDLAGAKATLVTFMAHGPGGGNPCVVLGFENRLDAEGFAIGRWADDGIPFARSQVREVSR